MVKFSRSQRAATWAVKTNPSRSKKRSLTCILTKMFVRNVLLHAPRTMLVAALYFYVAAIFNPNHDAPHSTCNHFHPVQILYDHAENHVSPIVNEYLPKNSSASEDHSHVNKVHPSVQSDSRQKKCILSRTWHTKQFQMCNSLHELDIQDNTSRGTFEFVACGGTRCAYHIKDTDAVTSLALKKRKYKYDSEPDERTRRDGLVMERLTKSPYVLSIYGSCGDTQVLEYASGGNIFNLMDRARREKKDEILPIDKLRIAIQLVTAVADLHTFEKDNVVSITHNDICCHQFVYVDGVYKLNDFHLSSFVERNNTSNEICKNRRTVASRYKLIHSPEESFDKKVDNEKADDYVVGNVLYYVLTNRFIFEDRSYKKGIQSLRKGERSPFPDHIQNSSDPADIAVTKGIQMLWTHDVDERPTARQVSQFLIQELQKIVKDTKLGDTIRVSIPPFPHGFDFSHMDDSGLIARPDK